MKKLMALCLSLLMALSMCSFTAMAAGETTDQSQDLDGGAAFNAIAVENATTLDSYDFTTASTHDESTGVFTNYSKWKRPAVAGNSEVKDGELHIDLDPANNGNDRCAVVYTMPTLEKYDIVGIQFDMNDIVLTNGPSQMRIGGYVYNAAGTRIGHLNSGGNVGTVAATGLINGFFPASSSTKHITLEYDPMTGDVWTNGVLSSKNLFSYLTGPLSGSDDLTVAKAVITSIQFIAAANTTTNSFDIDNFVVYQKISSTDAYDSQTVLVASQDFSDLENGYAEHQYDYELGQTWVHLASAVNQAPTGGTVSDRFIFKTDVKYTHDETPNSYGGFGLLTLAGKRGAAIYFDYNNSKIGLTTTKIVAAADSEGGFTVAAQNDIPVFFDMPESVIQKGENAWVRVMIDYNAMSQSYYAYVDGILINEYPLLLGIMQLTSNAGNAVRGCQFDYWYGGITCLDNMELRKFTDTKVVEVNAALNAALVDYGSESVKPALLNTMLPAKTIGASWVSGGGYMRDLDTGDKIKPSNVSTYTYVNDGPTISWKVDGADATYSLATAPKVVQLTATATLDDVTESKTVTRKVAPTDILQVVIDGASVKGLWIRAMAGTEKLIIAKYLNGKLIDASIPDLSAYDEETGILPLELTIPGASNGEYDQMKFFLVGENGITPASFAIE